MAHLDAKKAAIAGDWDKAWCEAQRDPGFQDVVSRVYWTRWMVDLLANEGAIKLITLEPLYLKSLSNQLQRIFAKPVNGITKISEANTACMAAAYADYSRKTPLIATVPDYYIVGKSDLAQTPEASYFAIVIFDNDEKTHIAVHVRIDAITNQRSELRRERLHNNLANAATSAQALFESYRFTWLSEFDERGVAPSAKIA